VIVQFDTNEAYEHFQFYWYAVKTGLYNGGLRFAECQSLLELRLHAVSRDNDQKDGGRVLLEECSMEFTDEERVVLARLLSTAPWKDDAIRAAQAALRYLGVEVEFKLTV